MKSNFETCLAKVLEYEGGYVNDPKDPVEKPITESASEHTLTRISRA